MTDEIKTALDTTIAIGEYGTQLFWWNPTGGTSSAGAFEYALPLVSGGEYGGDTETYEAPELDLDYIAKISGPTTLDDITLTSNYTKGRYARWVQILSNDLENPPVYMEVYADNSATLYSGTSGRPTIQGGDVRQIEVTIAPMNMVWVENINSISDTDNADGVSELDEVNNILGTSLTADSALPIDKSTIPTKRLQFFDGNQGK